MPSKPPSLPPEPGSAADEVVRTFKHIAAIPGGAVASWRVIWLLFVFVFGGGSVYTGWRFVTVSQAKELIVAHDKERAKEQDELTEKVGDNTTAIVGLTAQIGSVQKVQHQDIAHREARRVIAEEITCRRNDNGCARRREQEKERVRRLNMKRLEDGKTPCAKLACSL